MGSQIRSNDYTVLMDNARARAAPSNSPSVSIRQDHFMQRMDVEKINFKKLFRDVRLHIDVGTKLYQAKRTDSDARFHDLFESLDNLLGSIQRSQEILSKGCSSFDFINSDGSRVKGNGYRSMLFLLSSVLQPLHNSLQKAAKERGGVFYSPVDHYNGISSHCRALQGMEITLRYSVQLMEASSPPNLFDSGELCQMLIRAAASEYMCRDELYGRCLGIQYSPTLKPLLKMIGVGMASYEKWYNAEKDDSVIKQVLQSLWKGREYLQNPVQMGLKLDSLTHECSVHFVKAFWSLMEQDAVKGAMKLVAQSIGVRTWLEVPAKPITVQGSKGAVEINPPHIGLGYKPVRLLLLSHKWREGQERTHHGRKEVAPPATGLIVHMHGGGYVAQSPCTHEFYLRQWSLQLDTPIVSIDYSLAPEAPFPRALEECVMVYAWILNNMQQLGTTGERIVLAGDSSGGNFAFGVCMKLKELGLRMPDSILSIYPNVNASTSATPSRITALWDPILPLGVMLACQAAYSGQLPTPETLKMRKESRSKILKAQGYYLPDPDAKRFSPTLERIKRLSRRGNRHRGANSSDSSKSSGTGPPPRPPPPSTTSLKYAANTNSEEQATNGMVESFQEVELGLPQFSDVVLNGEGLEAASSASLKSEVGEEQSQTKAADKTATAMPLPLTVRHNREPDEQDKLSTDEIETLVLEVMKTYQDPEITKDPYMSPLLAPVDLLTGLPTAHIIGAALDPMLDDAVAMAHKLKSIGQPVTLNVLDHLPHGFLCMVSAGNNVDLSGAQKLCLDYLRKELQIEISGSSKRSR